MSQTSILSTKTLTDEQGKYFDANLIFGARFYWKKTTFELKTINNLIFSSQNAVLSLIEQNGWKFKTKPVFFV
jgi:uroporphyrinogen-III synthase